MRRSPYAAFAGIFVVTLLSLMAVGAVLPVLPRYVRGPLDSGNIAVGVVVGCYALTGLAGRPIAGRWTDHRGRKPVVVARHAARGARRLALSGSDRPPRPDRGPPGAGPGRGLGVHGWLGLDRRPGPAGAPRPGDRPIRAGGVERAQHRAVDRRAPLPRWRASISSGRSLPRRRSWGHWWRFASGTRFSPRGKPSAGP